MKNSYHVRSNAEIAHNGNLMVVKNKEELLRMLGFCEPLFPTAECGRANEEGRVSVPQEGSQHLHPSRKLPKAGVRRNEPITERKTSTGDERYSRL
jgi:hypothetical protein